ncbi:hypothetical protein ACFWFB_32785 [Streptomyces albidoflavus]
MAASRWQVGSQNMCRRAAGVLGAVLLLPALGAAIPVLGALMPGQTVVGGMPAWHGHVTVAATLLTALVGAVLRPG